jgi:hypothetical protein
MVRKRRRLRSRISNSAEGVLFFLLVIADDLFRGCPRPSSTPLVSGIRPDGKGGEAPLTECQLTELDAWLRLQPKAWRRNVIPPGGSSCMVQVKHLDSAITELLLFSRPKSAVYFAKHGVGSFDAGWTHPPAEEVDGLMAMLRGEA